MEEERIAAWDRLHEMLARMPGRVVGPPVRDPVRGLWTVTVIDSRVYGRGRARPRLEGSGPTEANAVVALADALESKRAGG